MAGTWLDFPGCPACATDPWKLRSEREKVVGGGRLELPNLLHVNQLVGRSEHGLSTSDGIGEPPAQPNGWTSAGHENPAEREG